MAFRSFGIALVILGVAAMVVGTLERYAQPGLLVFWVGVWTAVGGLVWLALGHYMGRAVPPTREHYERRRRV